MSITEKRTVRIIFDFQSCQLKAKDNIHINKIAQYDVQLCKNFLRNNKYQTYAILNNNLPQIDEKYNISSIQHKIIIFPELPTWKVKKKFVNYELDTLNNILFSTLINKINADIIHMSFPFGKINNQQKLFPCHTCATYGQLLATTVHFLPDQSSYNLYSQQTKYKDQWIAQQIKFLKQIHLIFVLDGKIKQELISSYNIDEKKIILLVADNMNNNYIKQICDVFDKKLHQQYDAALWALQYNLLPKLHLAWLTPFPPLKSGISYYVEQLLPELSVYFDIDIYVKDLKKIEECHASSNIRFFNIKNFVQNAKLYDGILYDIGNNYKYHGHMLQLLNKFPGIVTLHDNKLDHLILEAFNKNNITYDQYKEITVEYEEIETFSTKNLSKENILSFAQTILNKAIGIIAHSKFIFLKDTKFHSEEYNNGVKIIPQIIKTYNKKDNNKKFIKNKLNIPSDHIVITSFGDIISEKLYDRIILALIENNLYEKNIFLIFVGNLNYKNEFCQRVLALIKSHNLNNKILITHYVDNEKYKNYLEITDIAIQIRYNCHGGTSRAVLDCLSNKIPLIINNVDIYQQYPENSVYRICNNPNPTDIAIAINNLYENVELRNKIATNGYQYVQKNNNPSICAQQYAIAIHEFITRHKAKKLEFYHNKISPHLAMLQDSNFACKKFVDFFTKYKFNANEYKQRLLINVNEIVNFDHKTGIQRVVNRIIDTAYNKKDLKSVAFYINNNQVIKANQWLQHKNIGQNNQDSMFTLNYGDHILMLDMCRFYSYNKEFSQVFKKANSKNIPITTVIYDLLPIHYPKFFPKNTHEKFMYWLNNAIELSNSLLCISQTVAQNLIDYIKFNNLGKKGLKVDFWHLGADFRTEIQNNAISYTNSHKLSPYILMVSTVEPRKNYALALQVFTKLWQDNFSINLVIVGKKGWMTQKVIADIESHSLLNKKLFYFEKCDDKLLQELYVNATGMLNLSKNEGFGLSIIEAAKYNIPIICSDIAIFHEIAKDNVTYVNNHDIDILYEQLWHWWLNYKNNKLPSSKNIKILSWEESFNDLTNILFKKNWYWQKS